MRFVCGMPRILHTTNNTSRKCHTRANGKLQWRKLNRKLDGHKNNICDAHRCTRSSRTFEMCIIRTCCVQWNSCKYICTVPAMGNRQSAIGNRWWDQISITTKRISIEMYPQSAQNTQSHLPFICQNKKTENYDSKIPNKIAKHKWKSVSVEIVFTNFICWKKKQKKKKRETKEKQRKWQKINLYIMLLRLSRREMKTKNDERNDHTNQFP